MFIRGQFHRKPAAWRNTVKEEYICSNVIQGIPLDWYYVTISAWYCLVAIHKDESVFCSFEISEGLVVDEFLNNKHPDVIKEALRIYYNYPPKGIKIYNRAE